ncbi:MAG: formate dehydrogenase subunit delta [Novosphingobium meiothermophilum]
MSGHTAAKLAMMANQIARNLALEPEPARAMADHIIAFWTSRMIDTLLTDDDAASSLLPLAADAMARVKAARAAHGA